ncbi:MAG: hypothetical protein KGJ21_08725 [Pseudomonadota bacterium]|nr:hypothetical protein [Pseudomonadota bacterium]
MSVFDTTIATLFADPNMATDATFIPQVGANVAVRVIVRAPDVFQKMGSSVIETPTTTLEVKVADCPSILPGDQFLIGQTTFVVQGQPRRDELLLTWQVDLYAS